MYFLFNVRLLNPYDWKTRLNGLSCLLLKMQTWIHLLSCTLQSKIGFHNKLLMWPMSLNIYSNIYYYSKFHDSCSTSLKIMKPPWWTFIFMEGFPRYQDGVTTISLWVWFMIIIELSIMKYSKFNNFYIAFLNIMKDFTSMDHIHWRILKNTKNGMRMYLTIWNTSTCQNKLKKQTTFLNKKIPYWTFSPSYKLFILIYHHDQI